MSCTPQRTARTAGADTSQSPPMPRTMERLLMPGVAAPRHRFTLLQWNVLADGLAQHGEFVRVPPEALTWRARSRLVLDELKAAAADLICLQEVNRFDEFFQPSLAALGYEGFFFKKPASPCTQYGCPPDGCALFFNPQRFRLLHQPKGMYFQNGGEPGRQGLLAAALVHVDSGARVVVCVTHLKAKEGDANDLMREQQARQLLDFVSLEVRDVAAATVAAQCAEQNGNGSSANGNGAAPASAAPQVVVCGDFNATPTSAACEAMRAHPLGFSSVWDVPTEAEPTDVRPPFTTWKFRPGGEKKRTIDYVWYTGGAVGGNGAAQSCAARLVPLQRWSMPGCAQIGEAGLPSRDYPSDHLATLVVMGIECESGS